MSYPRALRDGKSGRPSSYILELKELFPWLKASYSLKEKREIYNEKKAREELARELPAMCKKSNWNTVLRRKPSVYCITFGIRKNTVRR